MDIRFSAKHRKFIAKQIKSGAAKTPQDVLDRAMTLFAEYDRKLVALRREIDKGVASADAGRLTPFDDAATARIMTTARRRAATMTRRKAS